MTNSSNNAPVLITGVGKRVGLYLAQQFMARGVPVIGTFRTEYPEVVELAEKGADLYCVDFYQDAEVLEFIQAVRSRYPRLRAIIHNASDWLKDDALNNPGEVMARMMQVHVSVPYQLNLALQDKLAGDGIGEADIIHLSDYVAAKGSKKHIAYAASKAALDNLTLSFAARFAPGIKVNSIAPALVCFNPWDDDAYKQKALSKAVLPREGGTEEVLATVDYLMSSRYITGRIMPLDGGRHLK
ncbi:dihydromonapterin reductase [Shewanella corallii]|uniref:Dihydromonapterin reductase n=1 Tax=Shewanella corallii TaxID=560080 RepID=A0ABT0N577_9GAMM|nr:dihydromonapterin reductase [Shewanella corallii]MCL2913596.1 dihydromonapterin reductase [Shewanella corallii]